MITVFGTGTGAPLDAAARAAVRGATLVVGGRRHLEAVAVPEGVERVVLGPLAPALDAIERHLQADDGEVAKEEVDDVLLFSVVRAGEQAAFRSDLSWLPVSGLQLDLAFGLLDTEILESAWIGTGGIDIVGDSSNPGAVTTRDVTIQRSIIGDNRKMVMVNYGTTRISMHHNLFVLGVVRMPLVTRTELPVDSDAYNSIGGFVFAKLGRLPKRGDTVNANGYSIRVESVRENRIEAVRIRERRAAAAAEQEAGTA